MKLRERKKVTFRYIEPITQVEANEMRQRRYDLEKELAKLRQEIGDLMRKYIRDKNAYKRKVRKEAKELKEYLGHGGKPVEKPATMVIDEVKKKIFCMVGERQVRFFHKGQWVLERDMTDEEFEINDFFDDEVDFDDPALEAKEYGKIELQCLQCRVDFDTPLDNNGIAINRTCQPCKKKAAQLAE